MVSGGWLPMCITLHLSGWKLSNHLSDQSCKCDMSFCRHSGLPGMSDLTYTFVSSANSLTPHLTVFDKSFINITNKSGPRTLPWGMPLVTSLHSDLCPLTTTHWCRPAKNALIQSRVLLHMPYDSSFTRRRS